MINKRQRRRAACEARRRPIIEDHDGASRVRTRVRAGRGPGAPVWRRRWTIVAASARAFAPAGRRSAVACSTHCPGVRELGTRARALGTDLGGDQGGARRVGARERGRERGGARVVALDLGSRPLCTGPAGVAEHLLFGDPVRGEVRGGGREGRALRERVLVRLPRVVEARDAERRDHGQHQRQADERHSERTGDRQAPHRPRAYSPQSGVPGGTCRWTLAAGYHLRVSVARAWTRQLCGASGVALLVPGAVSLALVLLAVAGGFRPARRPLAGARGSVGARPPAGAPGASRGGAASAARCCRWRRPPGRGAARVAAARRGSAVAAAASVGIGRP